MLEREADRFSCDLTGKGETMVRVLVKLSKDNLSNLFPHPLYALFNYSHPPVLERIGYIRAYCAKRAGRVGMIRVGTCSWAEKTLVASGEFYPPEAKTAEARLRYYAARFDTVEVDSTYYAIPDQRTAWLWDVRTPGGFTFHIKAYGALTGHAIDPRTLPARPEGKRGPSLQGRTLCLRERAGSPPRYRGALHGSPAAA